MPADLALGQLEDLLGGLTGVRRVSPKVVDHRVMKTQHRQVELRKDHVFVVPAIAQDGGTIIDLITW